MPVLTPNLSLSKPDRGQVGYDTLVNGDLDTLDAQFGPSGTAPHDHSGAVGKGVKLAQANSHEAPDTDVAATSLHHTLGASATQAAAGNHNHADRVRQLPLDVPPATPHALNDEFDGTALDVKWTDPATTTRTNTITVTNGALLLEPSDTGTGTVASRGGYGIRQVAPTGSFSVWAKVVNYRSGGGARAGDQRVGVFVADTVGGTANILGMAAASGRYYNANGIAAYSETADWGAVDVLDTYGTWSGAKPPFVYYRIRWVAASTTLYFDVSTDGYGWVQVTSRGTQVQPTRVGLAIWGNNASIEADGVLAAEFFRVSEP